MKKIVGKTDKIKIHEFNTTIYPYTSWVVITNDINILREHFLDRNKDELKGEIFTKNDVTLVLYATRHITIDIRKDFRIFDGIINNKSELKKLLKQLEIYSE